MRIRWILLTWIIAIVFAFAVHESPKQTIWEFLSIIHMIAFLVVTVGLMAIKLDKDGAGREPGWKWEF